MRISLWISEQSQKVLHLLMSSDILVETALLISGYEIGAKQSCSKEQNYYSHILTIECRYIIIIIIMFSQIHHTIQIHHIMCLLTIPRVNYVLNHISTAKTNFHCLCTLSTIFFKKKMHIMYPSELKGFVICCCNGFPNH